MTKIFYIRTNMFAYFLFLWGMFHGEPFIWERNCCLWYWMWKLSGNQLLTSTIFVFSISMSLFISYLFYFICFLTNAKFIHYSWEYNCVNLKAVITFICFYFIIFAFIFCSSKLACCKPIFFLKRFTTSCLNVCNQWEKVG